MRPAHVYLMLTLGAELSADSTFCVTPLKQYFPNGESRTRDDAKVAERLTLHGVAVVASGCAKRVYSDLTVIDEPEDMLSAIRRKRGAQEVRVEMRIVKVEDDSLVWSTVSEARARNKQGRAVAERDAIRTAVDRCVASLARSRVRLTGPVQ
ncbi:MAG: hypothetical protein FJW39_11235 [Acidobacteria bacterium]|nr:hypothetical protein [Acidobacteriota bacterium]